MGYSGIKALLLLSAFLVLASPAHALWTGDGDSICAFAGAQETPVCVTDGAGGSIIIWRDLRAGGGHSDIYAQRIDFLGRIRWQAGGIPVSTAPNDQSVPAAVSDGLGGSIITWSDARTDADGDIYAQHLDSNGNRLWSPPDGVPICTSTGSQPFSGQVQIASDGRGGAILCWPDGRDPLPHIYAQRIDLFGSLKWATNGIPICVAAGGTGDFSPQIVSDQQGGAYMCWDDRRSNPRQIYATRVDSTGTFHAGWMQDGIPVSGNMVPNDNVSNAALTADSTSGMVVAFETQSEFVRAVRYDGSGQIAAGWPSGGKYVAPVWSCPGGLETAPQITADGGGGAFVIWGSGCSAPQHWDIFAQHFTRTGVIAAGWDSVYGVAVVQQPEDQFDWMIIPDGSGGAIVTWDDERTGTTRDIFAQRLLPTSTVGPPIAWITNGAVLCSQPADQLHPALISDCTGGAVVTWVDSRNGNSDIYAQRVSGAGIVAPADSSERWLSNGTAFCSSPGVQRFLVAISDGASGIFLSWSDQRFAPSDNLNYMFAQHVTSRGEFASTANGIQVSPQGAVDGPTPALCTDGHGGFIATWTNEVSGQDQVFAARISSTGVLIAPASGAVRVAPTTLGQHDPNICPDLQGGAYITWRDGRPISGTSGSHTYLQHLDSTLTRVSTWSPAGDSLWLPTCNCSDESPVIAPDGFGGAIVMVRRGYHGDTIDADVFAQRFNSAGAPLWTPAGGVQVFAGARPGDDEAVITSDGEGGAIMAWPDTRYGLEDMFAQRVTANGTLAPGWRANGVPVCVAPGEQILPVIISDGFAGAIIGWRDHRGSSGDIYCQRIDSTGASLWGNKDSTGFAVCTAPGEQDSLTIAPDGTGGAVLTWTDQRPGLMGRGIFATRILGNGAVAQGWPASDGLLIADTTGDQIRPAIVTDNAGGSIIAWDDARNGGSNRDIYALGVTGAGIVASIPHWDPAGTNMAAAPGDKFNPVSISDGSGGTIVAWQDFRFGNSDIFAQRFDSTGATAPGWPACGLPICTALGHQIQPTIVSDSVGGALLAWTDGRDSTGTGYDIYAQRITGSGQILWAENGVPATTAPGGQSQPTMVSGPRLIAWSDGRNAATSGLDIYAVRLNSAGSPAAGWSTNGNLICNASGNQDSLASVSDGSGGAILGWVDARDSVSNGLDLYAQRVNGAGAVQWTVNGVPLAAVSGNQSQPTMVSDGASGCFVGWKDLRVAIAQIYAQHLSPSGATLWAANGISLAPSPGGQDQPTMVSDGAFGIIAAWRDARNLILSGYDIYAQRLNSLGNRSWGTSGDGVCTAPGDQSQPTMVSDTHNGIVVGWTDARRRVTDSGVSNTHKPGKRPGRNAQPTSTAQADPGETDLYALRLDSGGLRPVGWPANGVVICNVLGGQSQPTMVSDRRSGALLAWQDSRNSGSDIFVTRITSDGKVGSISGIAAAPQPVAHLALFAPRPNPTHGASAVDFELPVASRVTAEIFDAAGRRLRILASRSQYSPGPHSLYWDGRLANGLAAASGVYYLRVQAGSEHATRRVVLLR